LVSFIVFIIVLVMTKHFRTLGLSFLILGMLKLGVIVGFFPRHILVGYVSRYF
jgi:MFS superfamily sulfate permease-like transporter